MRYQLPPLIKLNTYWQGKVNGSVILNLNNIVKMFLRDNFYEVWCIGDTHQDVISISTEEFHMKMDNP